MAYSQNTPTVMPEVGYFSYLRSMKDRKEIAFDAMIDEAERDFAAGRYYTTEEVLKEIEEEFLEPYTQEELLEMAETGRQQIAEGNFFTTEEVMQHCITSRTHHEPA